MAIDGCGGVGDFAGVSKEFCGLLFCVELFVFVVVVEVLVLVLL